jgi:hypothetical protein
MRHILQGAALLAAAAFVWPLLAQDKAPEKKDPPEPKKEEKKEEKKESPYKSAGAPVTAKIVHIDEGKKHLKVKVPSVNQGEANAMQDAQRRYAQAQIDLARARDVGARNNALNAMNAAERDYLTHKAKLYSDWKDMEFDCLDEVKVRLSNPPARFNEKGDIVKPTKQELEELKGPDKSLPGYTGEFGDMRTDQVVQLSLVVRKDLPPELKNKKPNEWTAEEQAMLKPQVSLIYVIEAPQGGQPGPGK